MPANEGYSGPLWIEIDRIDPRPASEMRASVVGEAVEDYAENFDDLPPIRVVADSDDKHWTADGSYRIRAARHLGKKKIHCLVKAGTYLDAFGEASKANKGHGVQITKADKRARARAAVLCPEMHAWSNQMIADYCAVSHDLVRDVRPVEVTINVTSRLGKDGKSYPSKRNTPARSNAPKPDPKPLAPPAEPEPALSPADVEIIDGLTDFRDSIEADEPAAPPEPEPVVFRMPGPAPVSEAPVETDWDALLEAQEASIEAQFDMWPPQYNGMFVIMLRSLANDLAPRCPTLKDRRNELLG